MKPLLPSIGYNSPLSGSAAAAPARGVTSHGHGPTLLVKQLKTLNSSPIRKNILKSGGVPLPEASPSSTSPSPPPTIAPRSQSADSEVVRKSVEEINHHGDGQSIAMLRVMKSIRKQRLIQQKTEEEMNKDRKLRADKMQIKNSQRHRQRAEIYAINAYLKSVEQQRYHELIQAKSRGETARREITYDSDSSGSHDPDEEEDSDDVNRSNSSKLDEKKGSQKGMKNSTAAAPARSYGV